LWDLDVYVAGARAVLEHEDLYTAQAHERAFTYPPFAAAIFVPLAWLGAAASWAIGSLSSCSYVAIVLVLARHLRLGWMNVAVVAVTGLAIEPVVRTFVLGQINIVLMMLVLVDALILPSRFKGLLIGLAAGVKLTPAIFVMYYVLKGDFRSVWRAALAFSVTVVVGWLAAPQSSLEFWTHGIFAMDAFGDYELQPSNQSIRALMARALHTEHVSLGSWLVLVAFVSLAGLWVARRRLRAHDDLGALLAIASTGLLVSPVSWTHHWVWAVAALAYAVAGGFRLIALTGAFLFFVAPMWLLANEAGDGLRLPLWQVAVSGTDLLVGLIGLVLLAFRRGGPVVEVPR
jgi:alpha-1,2-mannosyltransferase